ncbi:MAG: hypothetical protein NTX07_09645 [Solirubrobacterales bacterium]|nr:hypothetical protein [Solirubrobacterales bacterium]
MLAWWKQSPQIRWREVWIVAAASLLVAIIQFFPLITQLSSHIATDLGDPLSQSWQIAWDGHALLHQPLAFWQSNQFWPANDSLAFSDALVGYAPFGLLGTGAAATVRNYNIALLFSFGLALLATYLLAREFGIPPWAAAVAGAAFAYSPWRLWQTGHMHVVASGGIPLAIFLLMRGYRRSNARLIVAGWLAAGWLGSIGFTLGIQLDYVLLALGILSLVCWVRAGRPKPPARVVWASVSGTALFLLITWLVTRPYLRVLDSYPHNTRSLKAVLAFSPGLDAFITPPRQSLLWSGVSEAWRPEDILNQVEKSLYPGIVAVLLAVTGLGWKQAPKALRVGLGLATIGFAILSLGVHAGTPWRFMPYRFLYEVLPGWDSVRTPGRIHGLTTLCLALLAGMGAARTGQWVALRRTPQLGTIAVATLAVLVLVDGSGLVYPQPKVPMPPSALASIEGPMLQLPAEAENNRRYLVWSTEKFTKMVNGRSSFTPPSYKRIVKASKGFPSASSISRLRRFGVKTVVVHTEFREPAMAIIAPAAKGESWHSASTRDFPRNLGVRRTLKKPLVIYELRR